MESTADPQSGHYLNTLFEKLKLEETCQKHYFATQRIEEMTQRLVCEECVSKGDFDKRDVLTLQEFYGKKVTALKKEYDAAQALKEDLVARQKRPTL